MTPRRASETVLGYWLRLFYPRQRLAVVADAVRVCRWRICVA